MEPFIRHSSHHSPRRTNLLVPLKYQAPEPNQVVARDLLASDRPFQVVKAFDHKSDKGGLAFLIGAIEHLEASTKEQTCCDPISAYVSRRWESRKSVERLRGFQGPALSPDRSRRRLLLAETPRESPTHRRAGRSRERACGFDDRTQVIN